MLRVHVLVLTKKLLYIFAFNLNALNRVQSKTLKSLQENISSFFCERTSDDADGPPYFCAGGYVEAPGYTAFNRSVRIGLYY